MDRHPLAQRLIGDKGLQLGEAPRMEGCALRPPSPHPRANVRQIFDGYRPLCAFGLRNNPFGETVVDIPGKAGFLPSQDFEPMAAALRALRLKLLPKPTMPIAHVVDRAPAVDFPIAIDGDIRHAQVDPQNTFHIKRVGFVAIDGSEQVPLPPHEGKVAFAALEWQHRALVCATDKGNGQALIECPDRYGRVRQCKRENAIIVGNRGCGTKRTLGLGIKLVGVSHFRQRTNNHLRRQPKGFSYVVVAQLLERKLAKRAAFPRDLADMVTRRIRRYKRANQGVSLFRRGQEFQLHCQFHIVSIPRIEHMCNYSLKRAKAGGVPPSAGCPLGACWASRPEG